MKTSFNAKWQYRENGNYVCYCVYWDPKNIKKNNFEALSKI